ncbi:MAG: peptidoglycan-binding protein [Planctomycetes bacterium]|nr:peptidoglycan-binding protein [Planctomycetota bacterium]
MSAPDPSIDLFRFETTQRQVVSMGVDQTTTLRLRGARPVTVLELPAADAFHAGSAVLLPTSPAGEERSGLAALALVLRHLRAHPAERLLVAAHEPGDEPLSRARAQVALALLLGLHAEAAARCQARHEPRDVERALAFVARHEGWPCDPAAAGGVQPALDAFRREFEAARGGTLPAGGPVAEADWAAFSRCYDAALERALDVDAAGLAALRARVALVRVEGAPPPAPPPPPPRPARGPDPVIRPGSAEPAVADLQALLDARGYPTGASGLHDDDGQDAARWFQGDHGLTADAVVGEPTWRLLRDPHLPAQPWPPATQRSGSRGSRVRRLQAALNHTGAALTVDGKFGPKTHAAAQAFQRAAGLSVDGIVGPQTWGALLERMPPPGPPAPHLLDGPPPVEPPAPPAGPDLVAALTAAAVGCGESWPPERARLRDYAPTCAARVDFLLFPAADAPVLACHPGEGDCTWKTCDLYRKGKYTGVVLAPPPPPPARPGRAAYLVVLPEATAFQTAEGKAPAGPLFQPGAGGDSGCLEGLARLLRRGEEVGADRWLVATHGEDPLGARRAESAAALLQGRAGWVAHSKQHATVADWQRLLRWVDATRQWRCDPGAIDGLAYGNTKAALDRFRGAFFKQHGVWLDTKPGAPTTKDWEAFHTLYLETLGQLLGGDAAARLAALAPAGPGHAACGAAFPAGAVEMHDYLGVEDRRLEVLLFTAADAPAGADAVYRGRGYRAEHVDLGEAHRLLARVVDQADAPLADVAFEVVRDGRRIRAGRTGADGLVSAAVVAGTYRVRVLGAAPELGPGPAPWEGGDGALEALLAGDYQRRGAYHPDMTGFKSPDLQRWLRQACERAGCDPLEVTKHEEASGGGAGDAEQGLSAGVPRWLTVFQTAAATAKQWGTQEQVYSRLMGAFYYSYFVERFYAPAGEVMPANVEYFLEHLGMSTGNGAATLANIGAGSYAYCAAASSKAYLKGLEAYGWGTHAQGYAPGGPGQGHGLPVGFTVGRKAGEQHRPRPGDVLSVHTAVGPPDGHVVTVAWAETNGTKDGWLWHVSGNAMHRAVCCAFSRLADDPGPNTKKGTISTINRSHDHELQPHTLAAMTPAEVEARRCFRLPGEHPPPNAPGAVGRPRAGGAPELLLVAGDVPAHAVSAPAAPTPLRVELKVVAFRGRCGEQAGERVLVAPGAPLRLEWEVQSYDRVVLQPGDRDVTERTLRGEAFVELSPADAPPDAEGRYTLEAWLGQERRAAHVEVAGILDLRVSGRDPDARSKNPRKAELLQRKMEGGHPRYGTPHYVKADSVGAYPGAFQDIAYDSDDGQHWFWGQITPRSDARITWKAIWPEGRPVRLTVNREVGKKTPTAPLDVTAACRREGGLLVGEHDHLTHGAYLTFFEVDLQLAGADGAPEVSATVRLRENYELPGLKSFELWVDGRQVLDGQEVEAAGKRPTVKWELTGSHSGNGLELLLLDAATGDVVASEVVRRRPQPGEPTPAENKKSADARLLAMKLPAGHRALRAVLELQNIKGRVAHRQVAFTIPGSHVDPGGGGSVDALPDELEVHLFDDEGLRCAGPYKMTMGSWAREATSPDGVARLDLRQVPAAARGTSLELEWGPKDALGHRFSRTLFLGYEQGGQEEQARRRLHNLGYPVSRSLEENLRWFQDRTPGLTPTGRPDAATLAKLKELHDQARVEQHEAPAAPGAAFPAL